MQLQHTTPNPVTLGAGLEYNIEAILAYEQLDHYKYQEYLVLFLGFASSFKRCLLKQDLEKAYKIL